MGKQTGFLNRGEDAIDRLWIMFLDLTYYDCHNAKLVNRVIIENSKVMVSKVWHFKKNFLEFSNKI